MNNTNAKTIAISFLLFTSTILFGQLTYDCNNMNEVLRIDEKIIYKQSIDSQDSFVHAKIYNLFDGNGKLVFRSHASSYDEIMLLDQQLSNGKFDIYTDRVKNGHYVYTILDLSLIHI